MPEQRPGKKLQSPMGYLPQGWGSQASLAGDPVSPWQRTHTFGAMMAAGPATILKRLGIHREVAGGLSVVAVRSLESRPWHTARAFSICLVVGYGRVGEEGLSP